MICELVLTGYELMSTLLVDKILQDCLKRCIKFVEKGASVFFFPEGTRSKDGKLGTFKVKIKK